MHLSLSPEQFERLLKLTYAGEILLNDWTPPEEQTDEHRACSDLLLDLCQRAEGTPAERYVTRDEASGEWVPSQLLKNEMETVVGEYDNDVFWDELATRLARRDLLTEYGDGALYLTPTYRKQAEAPLLAYYWNEVRNNGLDRMIIKEDLPVHARQQQPRSHI